MAQWVDMKAEKSRTERMSLITLLEADSKLLICRTTPKESKIMRETGDFYFITTPCLPIEPLGGL